MKSLGQMLKGISVDSSYAGPALYAVKFNHGVKFGISRNLRTRLKTYEAAWCHSIESIRAITIPEDLLKAAEALVLRKFPPVRRRGEFVHCCTPAEVLAAFEDVAVAFHGQIESWDEYPLAN